MTGASASGLRLSGDDGRAEVTDLAGINAVLAPLGMRVWPLPHDDLPPSVEALLGQDSLTEEEVSVLKDHFCLGREALLALIRETGREPAVAGGGALSTREESHGNDYPQLYQVGPSLDFSRFHRLHINRADDGTAVDETIQLLCGGGICAYRKTPEGTILTLALTCPSREQGWIMSYSGGEPHTGSVDQASVGTKILVQVSGPPCWKIRHVEEQA